MRRFFFENYQQPSLYNYSQIEPNINGLYKYHFSSRRTSLAGRKNELLELSNFCNTTEQNFSWWSIIGVGSSGKSRIALEFGKTLENDWHWGWLDLSSSSFKFENWQPDKNTLIIIDYIIGQEQNLHRLYSALSQLEQDDELLFKIRILLIERVEGQWFQQLKMLPHHGNFISSTIFKESPLQISKLDEECLMFLAKEALINIGTKSIKPEKIVALAVSMSADKAPLLIQLIAENKSSNADMQQVTRLSIEQDKIKRWKPAMVTEEDEEVLILSTLCGGVQLQQDTFSKSETKDYFSKYNSFDKYSIMTGRPENKEYLQPLEPDLFGELLVLDNFLPNNPLNNNKSRNLLRLALGVNNGLSLVAFFTRCSQDFPKHESLGILKTPFAEEGNEFFIWALTISNVIDVINFSTNEKLEIYEKTISGLRNYISESQIIDRVIFLRLLNNFSDGDKCQEYLGYFEVREPSVPTGHQSEKEEKEFLDSLLPEEYCKNIISTFLGLDNEYKARLLGPHLINVYHHLLMRMASDRSIDFKNTINKYEEVCGLIEENAKDNYFITIFAFHHLSANLAICIWQFNRFTNKSEYRLEFANTIKSRAFKYSYIKLNGSDYVVRSSQLARLYQPLTVYYANAKARNYKKLIDLIKEYKLCFQIDDQLGAEIYVGCCVQLAHGFQIKENYDYFLDLYDECKILTEKYRTNQIAENFSLIVTQMLRNNNVEAYALYIQKSHDDMFLNDAVNLSISYPNEKSGILSKVFCEISNKYKKAINAKDYDDAQRYIDFAIKIISNTKQVVYNERNKVWPGEIATAGLMDYIHNKHPLNVTCQILTLINEAKYFALDQTLFQIPSLIFSEGQKAKNKGKIEVTERCKECLRVIKPYLLENQSNAIDQLIEHLNV